MPAFFPIILEKLNNYMKKLLLFALFFLLITHNITATEKGTTFASLSLGHSWFHKYSGFSKHGMNFSLNYEPGINRFLNIDHSIILNIYWNDTKMVFIAPQFTVGPRLTIPFFRENLFFFLGTGLSFLAGIDYFQETKEAKADFSPGFYCRTGLDVVFFKYLLLGIDSKYTWNVVHNPHLLSLTLKIGMAY